ncbi:MAG: NADH-plastoquinone oxidoreductase subunit [Candidatus Bathyarchaeota archaeon BA1]|nr:MAG: NADH-plastoquinone oxidoreductase subunit [Candidatus Bathyarchaeota archaeon BA1]
MASSATVWYPTVFPDRCDGCEGLEKPHCIEFCPYGVFELRDVKALVVYPHKCVYGCIACERLCPKKAIAFPQRIATMPKIKSENKGLLRKVK